MFEAILSCVSRSIIETDSSCGQVTFISGNHDWGVGVEVFAELESPLLDLGKRVDVCLVVDYERTRGLTVVDGVEGMVAFLPCRIPDVHGDGVSHDLSLFLEKRCVESRFLAPIEDAAAIAQEKGGFTDTSCIERTRGIRQVRGREQDGLPSPRMTSFTDRLPEFSTIVFLCDNNSF